MPPLVFNIISLQNSDAIKVFGNCFSLCLYYTTNRDKMVVFIVAPGIAAPQCGNHGVHLPASRGMSHHAASADTTVLQSARHQFCNNQSRLSPSGTDITICSIFSPTVSTTAACSAAADALSVRQSETPSR